MCALRAYHQYIVTHPSEAKDQIQLQWSLVPNHLLSLRDLKRLAKFGLRFLDPNLHQLISKISTSKLLAMPHLKATMEQELNLQLGQSHTMEHRIKNLTCQGDFTWLSRIATLTILTPILLMDILVLTNPIEAWQGSTDLASFLKQAWSNLSQLWATAADKKRKETSTLIAPMQQLDFPPDTDIEMEGHVIDRKIPI